MQFTGIGRIRVFSAEIRRGVDLIENYVYNAIEKGCEPIVINAIVSKHGKESLLPTVVSYAQIRALIDEVYLSVKQGYGFFKDVENEDQFKKWLHTEIDRRIRAQVSYLGLATEKDKAECAGLIEKRVKAFNSYLKRTDKNAAQQRHEDIQNMRVMCKRCWDERLTVGQLCLEFELSEAEVHSFRSSIFYLREVRAMIINSRSKEDAIKWLKSYKSRISSFASRMGIKKDITERLFIDIYSELTGEVQGVPITNCERRGQKGLAPTIDKEKKAPICSLCETEYYLDNKTGYFTHP